MAYPVARKSTRVSGRFGPRAPIPLPGGGSSPNFHGGVDFTPLVQGSPVPVYAVGAGVVVISDRHVERGDRSGIDVGIRLDGDRSIWWYGHLSRADVVVGQRVRDGQQIGLIGATGLTSSGGRSVTGVHLHLERHWPSLNAETDPWPYIANERDIDGNTSSWQTGNPPAAVGDSSTATPAKTPPVQIEEGDMIVVRNTKTGHVYTAAKQYLRHETHGPSAEYVAKVLTAEDKYVQADEKQFEAILNALGVPPAAATAVLRGKLWSPHAGVVDARTITL